MRLLIIANVICAVLLSGCNHFGHRIAPTRPANSGDLSLPHNYKIPKKIKNATYINPFQDPQIDQLIAVAMSDAPDVLSAKARLVRSIQYAKEANASLWPNIGLDGQVQKQSFPLHGTAPPVLKTVPVSSVSIERIALNFNYELDFWGKNRHTVAARLSETVASGFELAQTQLIISAAVTSTYLDLQNSIVQLEMAKENARMQKQLANIIFDREKQGIESNIPVKTALSDAQEAILSVGDYQRMQNIARHQLAVLMGKNPFTTQIETLAFGYHKKQLALPKIIPANVLAQRPDIAAARALAQAAAHQIHVAKAAFYPNINLMGILSYQHFYFANFFNINFPNNGATAAIDLPVFDAGARRANLGVSYANYELAVNQYNQTILNALKEVSDQLTNYNSLNEQVIAQSNAVSNTSTNYGLLKSRHSQGIIDFTQLIQIRQLLLQQKAQLFNLQTKQKQAYVALIIALGGKV